MKHLDIPGMTNLRDVGGLPAGPGRRVQPGLLMRSEAPLTLTAEAISAFRELDLRTVIDLRGEDECEARPNGLRDLVTVVSVPLPGRVNSSPLPVLEQLLSRTLAAFGAAELAKVYLALLDDHPRRFGDAVRALAAPGALPALVHCRVGKDRTGLVMALVLEAIGVPREEIVRDYQASTERRAFRRTALAAKFADAGVRIEDADGLFRAPREALEMAITHVEDQHGSLRAYLTSAAGVPSAELDALTAELTEPDLASGDGDSAVDADDLPGHSRCAWAGEEHE
jgi:protein-tyrosine phosphatase